MKSIHLKTLCVTMIAAFALAGVASAVESAKEKKAAPASAEQGKLDRHDQEFLQKAAEINLTEIELGKIAEKAATDSHVKKMAAMLVKDHSQANNQLARLAASKGVTLPTMPSKSDQHQIESMQKQQGESFDKEYLSFNQKGHQEAIALFEKEASRTQDPDIKAWAQKMIPDLKSHLSMSQSGMQAVGEKSGSHMKSEKKGY